MGRSQWVGVITTTSFFFFKLYIIVLVLPNIKMNPPTSFFLTPISLSPAGQEKGASHPGCGAQHTSRRDQNSEVRKPSFWTLVGGWGGLGPALLDPPLHAYSPHGLCSSAHIRLPSRSLLMFTMENCFYLLISQAMRYLRDPAVHPRDKQRMKQELSSELVGGVEGPACWGDPGVPAPKGLGPP